MPSGKELKAGFDTGIGVRALAGSDFDA